MNTNIKKIVNVEKSTKFSISHLHVNGKIVVGYTWMHTWEHLETLGFLLIFIGEGPRYHRNVFPF